MGRRVGKTMELLFRLVVLSSLVCHVCFAEPSVYRVGVGIADVTEPAADINMMGYANPAQLSAGIHTRQYSRTFIVDDGTQRVVFISVDCALMDQVIKTELNSQSSPFAILTVVQVHSSPVPGISLYETTSNENNHDHHDDIKHGGHGGDPGDSDESDSDVVLGADQAGLFIDDPLMGGHHQGGGGPDELGYGPPLSPSGNSEESYTIDDGGTTTVSSSYPSGSRSAVSTEDPLRAAAVAAAAVDAIAASPQVRPAKFPEYKH